MVVFESSVKNILQQMSYAVVGRFLCYRHDEDDYLQVRTFEDVKDQDRDIDLRHIFNDNKDLKK